MKLFLTLTLALVTNNVFAFDVKVIFKNDLTFTADSLESLNRLNETYSTAITDPQLQEMILTTVGKTVKLLPRQYLPPLLTINIEREAIFTKIGKKPEQIPLSMVFTFQIPTKNEIRYSDFEFKNHPEAIRTIIAHEVGHMLIEWACRAEGVTKSTDRTVESSHWVSSIYEGVADYISATVNNTTIIGFPQSWFARDLLKFDTLEDAHKGSISTLKLVENGWSYEGLIPRYQTYVDEMAEFKKWASNDTIGDGYVEAPWLAGQLWQLNKTFGSQVVFDAILKIAISGKQYINPEVFLRDVKLSLDQSLRVDLFKFKKILFFSY